MQFKVLGPVSVVDGVDTLDIGGPKQRTVLAMLIAQPDRPVNADVIAQAVYGPDTPPRGRRRVQTYVSTLRSTLGPVITKADGGWKLDVEHAAIDAVRFEALYRAAGEADPTDAARILRGALELWYGLPYSNVEGHGFLDGEVSRLTELRLSALESRIDADLATGRHGDLVAEIEALMARHPLREKFRAQHMLALYRAGRQQEALRSYQRMRDHLVEEFGLNPALELQELERRILSHDETLHVTPASVIQRRAVLIVDPGNPLDLARTPGRQTSADAFPIWSAPTTTVDGNGPVGVYPAGAATYLVCETMAAAVALARQAERDLPGSMLRMALDWGDISVGDSNIAGPPVSRVAALVSLGHPGQILISKDGQEAVLHEGPEPGLRFESLGGHHLPGIGQPSPVFQLLLGNRQTRFPPLDSRRMPPPLPSAAHRTVPGYELRESVGIGSIGRLHRAFQPTVGREVLVEVIPRSVASDPGFIQQFERGAQLLALLDHPHINPLFDYWREPDGAFLVYPHRRGGFLTTNTAVGVSLLEQIASALACCHSYGIVHGSVRPDRILLDEAGNAYLQGLPIDTVRAPVGAADATYLAPEVLAGETPTVASDVYSLGVLARSMRGLDDTAEPARVAVEEAATHVDPTMRPQTIADFMASLGTEAGAPPGDHFSQVRNPYKGLLAFHEGDAADFFGRSRLIDTLARAVARSDFVAVVGPSGIGKSSVVRAGLVPRLRAGEVDGSAGWVVSEMAPGPRPFDELRRALAQVAVDIPPDIAGRITGGDPGCLRDVRRALPHGVRLLLVVDQFEELFSMAGERATAAFLDMLVTTAAGGDTKIVIALRADFLDRPLRYSEFGELLGRNLVSIRAPLRDELAEAIAKPAEGVGLSVDSALVERFVADVHDRPGSLPLLQHTLSQMFRSRTSDGLTVADYERVGGAVGCLVSSAEDRYLALDEQQQLAAERVFLQMVTIIDDGPPIRHRLPVTEVTADADEVLDVFTKARLLVQDRDPTTHTPTVEVAHEALLREWPRLATWIETHRNNLATRSQLRLMAKEWEDSGWSDVYLLAGQRLSRYEAVIEASGLRLSPSEQELLGRSRQAEDARAQRLVRRRRLLTSAFGLAAAISLVLAALAVRSGRIAEDRRQAAEQAEAAATEQAGMAQEQRDRAATLADEAERNRRSAEGRVLLADMTQALETDPQLALLLAVGAADRLGDTAAASAALHQAIAVQPRVYEATLSDVRSLFTGGGAENSIRRTQFHPEGDLSPDGRLLAVVGPLGTTVDVHDVDAGELLWSHSFDLEPAIEYQLAPRFTSSGTELIVGLSWQPPPDRALLQPDSQLGFHVFSARTGEWLRQLEDGVCGPVGRYESRWASIVESNGSAMVTMTVSQSWFEQFGCAPADPIDGSDWTYPTIDIGRFDPATETVTPILEEWAGGTLDVSLSNDGRRVALGKAASPGSTLTVLDVDSGEVVNRLGLGDESEEIALNDDGTVVTVREPRADRITLIDVASGSVLGELGQPAPEFHVTNTVGGLIRWSHPARLVAGGDLMIVPNLDRGEVRLYDADTGRVLSTIRRPELTGLVRTTPDGSRVAMFPINPSEDVLVRSLIPGSGLPEVAAFTLCPEDPSRSGGSVGPDVFDHRGRVIIRSTCGGPDGELGAVSSYNPTTGERFMTAPAAGRSIAVSDGGLLVQTWSSDGDGAVSGGDLAIIDVRTGDSERIDPGLCRFTWVEPEGQVGDCVSGEGPALLNHTLAVSDDGDVIAIGALAPTAGGLAVNGATGASLEINGPVVAVAISPDGGRLAVAEPLTPELGAVGAVSVHSTDDFEVQMTSGNSPEAITGALAFTRDGSQIVAVVGEQRNVVRFQDATTLAVARRIPDTHRGEVIDLELDGSGTALATVGSDGFARVWDVETFTLLDQITVSPDSTAITFTGNGTGLVVAGPSGVHIYQLGFDPLLRLARDRLERDFTAVECEDYFPTSPCPSPRQ